MICKMICAAALLGATAAPAGAQLFAAIAPEARTGQIGGSAVTLFVSAINNTDERLTGCRPVAEHFQGVSYQSVDTGNNLTGTADTPVTIEPGQTQGFVIAIDTATSQLGRVVARVECNERNSVRNYALGASVSIVDRSLADIIAIGVTPSGDGVIRIPEAGGAQAFATAAINIGTPSDIRVYPEGIGYTEPVAAFTVCETGDDGQCLDPPAAFVDTRFETDELRTFTVFVYAGPESGIGFLPDLQRVRLRFEAIDGEWEVGAASAAYTAPAPEGASGAHGIYAAYFQEPYSPGSDVHRLDKGLVAIWPDGRFMAWGNQGDLWGGGSGEWVMGGQGELDGDSLTVPKALVAENGDSNLLYASSELAIEPRASAIGTFAPTGGATGDIRAAYHGFLTQTEIGLSELLGGWDIVSNNRVIGSMTVRSDYTLSGQFTVGSLSNCYFGGTLTQPSETENFFDIQMRFQSSLVGCDRTFNGQEFWGLATILTDARPVARDFPMGAFILDDAGSVRSGWSLLFVKR